MEVALSQQGQEWKIRYLPTDTREGGNWSPATCFCKTATWVLSQLPTQACLTCGWGEGMLQFFLLVFDRNRGAVNFPGGSNSKSICLQCGRPRFNPWVGKIPWRRQWHPTPVLLPGNSHGRRSLVGCSPWGREESDTTELLHFHFSLSCIGEGNGNPLQCSCLENPKDSGAWWAAVYGVTQSRTQLK